MSASSSSASASKAGVAPVTEAGSGAAGGGGEGSSSSSADAGRRIPRTLADVMRGPSENVPDVVVLESLPEHLDRKERLNPREDLWLSTADGRYGSPIIPLHVGEHPDIATFYVHRDILIKYEYFEKALCGGFLESTNQALHFPDDDPAIFHFLVAFIYEGHYDPIRPIAAALIPDQGKGKGKDTAGTSSGDSSPVAASSSSSSEASDSPPSDDDDAASAVSRRRRDRRRRRADRHFERMRQKHPGAHRPSCGCPTCQSVSGGGGGWGPAGACWACAAPQPRGPQPAPPPPLHHHHHHHHAPPPPGPPVLIGRDGVPQPLRHRPVGAPLRGPRGRNNNNHYRNNNHHHAGGGAGGAPFAGLPAPGPPPAPRGGWQPLVPEARIGGGEDLRTWLLAYELNLDVYLAAHKFLLGGCKRAVARAAVDMLETAGSDAAVPQVLRLCAKMRAGLPDSDPLLRMVLARVGFLQALLWRTEPEATERFLVANPDLAAAILRETVVRREEDYGGWRLPSMERAWGPPGPPPPMGLYEYPRRVAVEPYVWTQAR